MLIRRVSLVVLLALPMVLLSHTARGQEERAVAQQSPDGNPQQLLQRGEQELQAGQFGAAVESFSQAIKLDPAFLEAYAARARAYRKLEGVAQTEEERDRAAIGYISDEQHVGKTKALPLIAREWSDYVTNRMFALAIIHTTAWIAVFYLLWYQGKPVGALAAICLIIHIITWVVPLAPVRYGLGPSVLFCIVLSSLFSKDREPAEQERSETAIDAAVREQEARQPRPNPGDYATNSKHCPSCAREVSDIARVCPRCGHRF